MKKKTIKKNLNTKKLARTQLHMLVLTLVCLLRRRHEGPRYTESDTQDRDR